MGFEILSSVRISVHQSLVLFQLLSSELIDRFEVFSGVGWWENWNFGVMVYESELKLTGEWDFC